MRTYQITEQQVYRHTPCVAPMGYEIIDFRPPRGKEIWVDPVWGNIAGGEGPGGGRMLPWEPLLILRKQEGV